MAEKGIDYRVEYGNFVLFGHDCGFGCRQTNNAPDDRTFQVSVVTCRRAPLHGGIPVDTRGSASRMARLSPLGARFAPCGGAGWKLGFQFYRKKFTPADIKRFFSTLPNGMASFVASSRGDVFTKIVYTSAGAHIDVTYRVINTTSATSFFLHLTPSWDSGPMASWTQYYIWKEEIPCCEDRTPFKIEVDTAVGNMKKCFPYNIQPDNVMLPANFFNVF